MPGELTRRVGTTSRAATSLRSGGRGRPEPLRQGVTILADRLATPLSRTEMALLRKPLVHPGENGVGGALLLLAASSFRPLTG